MKGNLADVEDNEDDSTGDSHPVVTSIHPDSLFFHDSCDTVPACQTVETCLSDQLASLKFDTCAESDYLVGHKPSDKTNSAASMLLNDKRNLSPVCHNFNDTILDSVTSWKDDFVYVKPRDLDLFGQTELQLASRLARQPLLDYTESNNLTDNLRQDGFDTQIGNLEECLSRYTASEVLTDLNSLFCEVCTARLSKPALEDKAVLTKTISEDRLTGEMESGIRTNENKSILVRQSIVKRDLLFILPPLLTIHLKRFQLVRLEHIIRCNF
ncbi:unnamed protein product [Protopolystoma xenopodis]|uniref:USP domain-containing protein n=1 Tax=Protopolystoma xenopodis TaxID=117903 RepID=A0A3S5BSD0_9PLAT|nr:unnamed protein product [Protopolystoma xenopodis]